MAGGRRGSPAAVAAAIRVSECRSPLLGLDEPVVTESELTGSLRVHPERLVAERELFGTLSVDQLEELAAPGQALVDKAMAMARGQHALQSEQQKLSWSSTRATSTGSVSIISSQSSS